LSDCLWTTFDVAERYGVTIDDAREALNEWISLGLVEETNRRDSVTGARLFQASQVLAAHTLHPAAFRSRRLPG
jgi:hypothetical protein